MTQKFVAFVSCLFVLYFFFIGLIRVRVLAKEAIILKAINAMYPHALVNK